MFCYVYIKKQEKQQDVLIKALDVFLICPVVFKKGADVLKFPVVKCEHILMYRLKDEGGNLAASKIRNLECPNYEICLIDYGCGKFNRKIHIMEQYP